MCVQFGILQIHIQSKVNMEDVHQQAVTEEIKATKKNWGRKLLYLAWVVEVIAAIIGLMIAWSMGYQTYQIYTQNGGEFPASKYFDLFLAALPFIMVAAAELLKIPFSYLVYISRSLKVKIFFTLILTMVTVITFETLLNGFLKQYQNITTSVDIPRDKQAQLLIKIADKEEQIKTLKEFDIDSIKKDIEIRKSEIDSNHQQQLQTLNNSRKQFTETGNATLTQQKISLESDIKRTIKMRDDSIARLEKNANQVSEESTLNQKNILEENNRQITELQNEKLRNEAEIKEKEAQLGPLALFGISGDIKRLRERNNSIDSQLNDLRKTNSNLAVNSAKNLQQQTNDLYQQYNNELDILYKKLEDLELKIAKNNQENSLISNIDEKIQKENTNYSQQLADLTAYRASQELLLATKKEQISSLESSLEPIKEEELAIRGQIIKEMKNNQIYLIARTIYGVDRSEVISEERLSLVAKFWFGSLAGIVSMMGVFLAFGSFILLYPKQHIDELEKEMSSGSSSFSKSLRKMLLALRKRIKEPKVITKKIEVEVPKEVIKEIPVDKVVFKEVPVEVVQKEVIHTPIYTNDPDLLKFGTTKVKDITKDD